MSKKVNKYNTKELRLKECSRLINKYKILQGYSKHKELNNFNCAIRNYGENINELALELGYTIDQLYPTRKPEGYYNNFDIIKNKINCFIEKYNRFPTQNEINKDICIDNRHLAKFGGIYELKRLLNYNDENDLVDDNGFYNKSMQEYYVSQFLIHNGITFKREGKIDKDYNYLYDFLIENVNSELFYVEVWGYNDGKSKRADKYREKMNKKIEVYNKNNLNLISINPDVFNNKKYKDITKSLYDIFKHIINMEFKNVDINILIPSSKLKDEDLKNELMKYSKDGITIPSQQYLDSIHRSDLYVEINKRFSSIFNFANIYGLKTEHYNYNYWCEEKIFEVFDGMINTFGRILNKSECQSEKYKNLDLIKGFLGGVRRNGGIIENRIKYYEKLIHNNIEIPQSEIEVINKILQGKAPYNKIEGKYNKRILSVLEAI